MTTPARPNVVLVTTDQQRADATAREGFALDTTPFLDSLAADGVWFDRAYTATPVCAPARVSLLTGRYPSATRVRRNDETGAAVFTDDLFDVFRSAGYATAMVGKNHSHLTPDAVDHWFELSHWGAKGPEAHATRSEEAAAFDEWIDELGWSPSLEPTPFPIECQAAARAVDHAAEWVADVSEPFFCWLSIPEPHNPYQVPEPYFSLFDPADLPPAMSRDVIDDRGFEWSWSRRLLEQRIADRHPSLAPADAISRMRANYYGMCRLIDDQLRAFVDGLEESGHRDETLLVVTSDHGDFVGDAGLMRKGPGLPESTTRVPLVVAGSDINRSKGPHPDHVSLVDVLPTLCEALGVDSPPGVQGRSFWQLVTGDRADSSAKPPEEFTSVYAEAGDGSPIVGSDGVPDPEEATPNELNPVTLSGTTRMVRQGDWKLVVSARGERRLLNLKDDSAERINHWDDPATQQHRQVLTDELLEWLLEVSDSCSGVNQQL
ncbi:sulfatase [Halomarina rubra]|uniref:Sulfatase n=1 Tax=Halomarina rubra TaxID=2071873 RepID=A0ABD6APY0_9EURY|nr:sulfatase-like hydrolase/transferase [Halomarina rubra]